MFCPNCGANVSDQARFCGSCGYAMKNAEVPPVQPVVNTVPSAENTEPAAPAGFPEPAASMPSEAPVQGLPEIREELPAPADIPSSPAENVAAPVQDTSVLPPDQEIFSGKGAYYDAPAVPDAAAVGSANTFVQSEYAAPPVQPQMPQPGIPAAAPLQPQQYIAAAPAAVKPAKKTVKKLNLGVTVVISILFGILAFALAVSSFSVGSVRQGLSGNVLSDGISNLDIGGIVVGDLLSDPAYRNFVESNNVVLPEKRVEKAELAEIIALSVRVGGGNFTADQIEQIINKLDINEELAVLVKAYEDYLISGKPGDEFEDGLCEEIKRIVKEGERDVTKITNMRLAENYEEYLDKVLYKNENMIESILPEKSLKKASGAIGIILNPIVLIAALVLSVVMVALIGIISKRVTSSLMTGGVVFILAGCVLFAASIIIQNLTMISPLDYAIFEDVISPLLYSAFGSNLLFSGIICAGIGIVLIVLFVVLKVVGKSRRNRAALQQN